MTVREIVKNRPGSRCAADGCDLVAAELLREQPHAGQRFSFAFCNAHADFYAAKGYERVSQIQRPGQMGLAL